MLVGLKELANLNVWRLRDTQDAEWQINCVAVHPSRPHLAASGASAGSVAVWDLRFAARPAHATLPGDAGEVWEVRALFWALTMRRDKVERTFLACFPAKPPEALGAKRAGQKQPVGVGWSRPGKQPTRLLVAEPSHILHFRVVAPA